MCKKILTNKHFYKHHSSIGGSGFTLIETILYLAIVGIILTSIIEFSITLGNTTTKLGSNIDASRDRRLSLNIINYLIRNAEGFLKDTSGDCSNFGVTPPILALYFNNDTWLPGTCVQAGGGVKITVASNRLKMTCYPNITNNGQYGACAAAAGNTFWLTSPDTVVTNSDLSFATSTATSTDDGFKSITTHINVSIPSAGQANLKASSAATSTAVLKNEQRNGLISWWKFDDASTAAAADAVGSNNLTCTGGPSKESGLINGSLGSFYFHSTTTGGNYDYCYSNNPSNLNLGLSFTISTWIKINSPTAVEHGVINKHTYGANLGYYLMVYQTGGSVYFRVCNSLTCSNILIASSIIANTYTYNITVVYDQPNDSAKMFIFKKGVGGVNTTTASSLPWLVNDTSVSGPIIGNVFDGQLDDVRVYNRALSDKEIWALQSAGN